MARRDGRDLDQEARDAGFPGGRREREAFRRAERSAQSKGTAKPKPPTARATYKPLPAGAPGGRGRKAPTPPASRARDRWHQLGGGGRVKTTGISSKAHSAIKGARQKRERVYLTVKADVVARYDQKESDQGEAAFSDGIDPADLLAAIDAANGDVKQGIADALEATGRYDSVKDVRSFTIRAYQ